MRFHVQNIAFNFTDVEQHLNKLDSFSPTNINDLKMTIWTKFSILYFVG